MFLWSNCYDSYSEIEDDVSESMDCLRFIVPRIEGRANVPRNGLSLQEDVLIVV